MGFDIECIPNIELLPGEFFCPVCRLLVYPNEALQSMCDHFYCPTCLAYVASTTMACPYDGYLVIETDAQPLVESNIVLADTIGETVVYCSYLKSGCAWIGSLSEIPAHCSTCAFGFSLVVCNVCNTQLMHRQAEEHARFCPEMQQVQVQMNPQGQYVAAAGEQWYQQQYQPYYQNNTGYYYMHQPYDVPMPAPQQPLQVPYVQPAIQYVTETHYHLPAPPQPQSQSLALQQPHVVFPPTSLPQANPSVLPHPQDLSHTFPTSQGHQHLQAHAPTSHQLHMPNPMHPHAYSSGQQVYPQANQTNQARSSPNNMHVHHQVGTQPPQVQPHPSPQFPHVPPPHSLPTNTTQTQQPSQSNRDQYLQHLVRTYGGVQLSQSSVMHLPNHHHTSAPTSDGVRNQMHHQGYSFVNLHITMQSHLSPMQRLQNHPQTFQVHQLITPNHGSQPQMNHNSATAFPGGSGQAAPCFPAVKLSDMEGTQDKVPQNHTGDEAANGVNDAVEKTTTKSSYELKGKRIDACAASDHVSNIVTDDEATKGVNDAVGKTTTESNHELKGKRIDACAASDHVSNIVVEGNELKSRALGKQVMEENVGNGGANLGKSHIVEYKGTGNDHSLNATPLEPASLGPDGLGHKEKKIEHLLKTSHKESDGGLTSHIDIDGGLISEAYPSGSLDRGFDQRSPVRPHEKKVPNQIRGGEMKEGVGFDSNALRLGDVGFTGRYTYHGFSGDGGSFSGDNGPFPNSRKRAVGPDEGLDLHSHTKEESMDTVLVTNHNAKKLKTAHAGASPYKNPKQNEESGSGGLG